MATTNPAYSIVPPVFTRVHVQFRASGGARVTWELGRHFNEPRPYEFQLQVSRVGLPHEQAGGSTRADDWENVGDPVVDNYVAYDPLKRLYGKTAETYYRLRLTTAPGLRFYSNPQNVYGDLDKRDYLVAREILRKELLRHTKQSSVRGHLLKAYRSGPICPCVDPLTKEIGNSHHDVCYGTGFIGGYFPPLPATYVDVTAEHAREALDAQTGTAKQQAISGRFLAEPQVYALDVWVAASGDRRYYIHPTKVEAQIRGVPLVVSAELRLAPYTDVLYTFPLGVG